MALPTVAKTFTYSVNNRITYVSLNDTMASFLYGMKNFLVATMGWTVKYTCDGTTGPSSGSDHTDRWASKANATTRGANTTTANSFAVLTDGNGIDWMLSYVGATDDVARISYSAGGLFVPAGTANQTPTATDEGIQATGITLINATTSQDRVFHMQASTDKKIFRCWIYRQGTMAQSLFVEVVNSTVTAMAHTPPVIVMQTNSTTTTAAGAGQMLGATMNTTGALHTAITRTSGGNINLGGCGEGQVGVMTTSAYGTASPELQAASPIVPLAVGSTTAANQGKVGNRIDAWFPFTNGIAQGDTFGALQFVLMGTGMYPWDGVNSPVLS